MNLMYHIKDNSILFYLFWVQVFIYFFLKLYTVLIFK